MGKILYINGEEEEKEITKPSLEELQKIVDGYIEVLYLKVAKDQIYSYFILNEEGISKNLNKNEKATQFFYKQQLNKRYNISEKGILGNVILLKKEEFN